MNDQDVKKMIEKHADRAIFEIVVNEPVQITRCKMRIIMMELLLEYVKEAYSAKLQ